MSGEKTKLRSRKRKPSKLLHWLSTEGRRYCAVALCASLIAGNIGQIASIADDGTESDYKFEMSRLSIYEALQEAVAEEHIVDRGFQFAGAEAETYEQLLEADGMLYEIFPEIEGGDKHVDLRVFARLTEEIVLDGTYEIAGDEEVIFVLNNDLDTQKTAIITVGDKATQPITLTPKSAISVLDENVSYESAEEISGKDGEIVIETSAAVEADSDDENVPKDTEISIVEDDDEIVIDIETDSEDEVSDNDADEQEEAEEADSQDVEVEIEAAASISSHKVYRVASAATPSDAEKEEATPSDATPSNADETELDGQAYEAVLMEGIATRAFATTFDDMDIDNLLVLEASPSNAGKMHTAEVDGIIVKAWVNTGVLPDDAELVVKKLDETEHEEQYQAAVEALEQSGTQYGGMMALDISFQNEEGEEIEPEGNVQVSIEMAKEALPENVSADMLTVQHLKETEEGAVEVQTVADTTVETDGTVEEKEDATIAAAFEVESFSTFTITWTGNFFWDGEKNVSINVHCVDVDGKEIPLNDNTGLPLETGETIVFGERLSDLPGSRYEYQGAYYLDGNEKKTITSATLQMNNVFGSYQGGTLTLRNNDAEVKKITFMSDKATIDDVYLVYKRKPNNNVSVERELKREKTVIKRDKVDEYDLTLTVSGAIGSITDPVDVDILLILDASGSMKYRIDRDTETDAPNRRIDHVVNAVGNLAEIIEENKTLNTRYSVVKFASRDATEVLLDWQAISAENLKSEIIVEPNGGTNYQQGIVKGIEQLEKAGRPSAKKIVIFLTDGEPTLYNYGAFERPFIIGGGFYSETAQKNAENEIQNLSCDAFYAVGVALGNTDYGEACLHGLCDNVDAVASDWYSTSNAEGLQEVFANIAGEASTILCDHVVITDELSEWVDFITIDGKTAEESLQIIVEDVDGKLVKIDETELKGNGTLIIPATERNGGSAAERTLKATYDGTNKKIQLKFPENYKLEPNWTYKVVAGIKVNSDAYKEYKDLSAVYPSVGATGTGTHANDSGFYSNSKAEVTYEYGEDASGKSNSTTLEYPMPVVQLSLGQLVIEKEIEISDVNNVETAYGELNSSLNKLLAGLTFEIQEVQTTTSGETTPTGEKTTLKASDDGWKVTTSTNKKKLLLSYELKDLIPDTKYTVTEKIDTANLTGYQRTTKVQTNVKNADGTESVGTLTDRTGATVTIGRGTETAVAFVNTYKPSLKLTVKKVVDGKLGDRNKEFTFTVKVERNIDGNSKDITSELYPNNENTFTLKHGETSKEFGQLRKGDIVTITETDAKDYDTVVWVGRNEPEDISKNKTWSTTVDVTNIEVNIKNTKDPEIDTGILLDSMPYVIILAAAAAGAVFYFVRKKKEDDDLE